MLVLTRKTGEAIIISDSVIVTALNIRGRKTRLGIYAPRSVPVNRLEIHERIQEEHTGGLIHYGRCLGGDGMLVLSRVVGEAIMIDGNVKVIVLGVNGGYMRIGIEAPKTIPVHREEIWQKIQRESGNLL